MRACEQLIQSRYTINRDDLTMHYTTKPHDSRNKRKVYGDVSMYWDIVSANVHELRETENS